jgi:hypothetical protein
MRGERWAMPKAGSLSSLVKEEVDVSSLEVCGRAYRTPAACTLP